MKTYKLFGALLLAGFAFCAQPAEDSKTNHTDVMPDSTQVSIPSAPKSQDRRIVFFGNSLTAAYGLDPSQGFTSLIQARIDSLGLNFKVINAGLSGETTAGGNERIEWVLQQPLEIFVLELGGNDGLRGIAPETTYKNLESIIQKVRGKYPTARIILAGMEAPPNMGSSFTGKFHKIYPQLTKEYNLTLIPFLLEGVGGIPQLNQADGIHPNQEGSRIVAENVWRVLQPLLNQ